MEGRIFSYIHFNGQVGTLIKLSTVTDFAARTDEFLSFGKDLAMQVAMTNPPAIGDLLAETSIKVEDVSIRALLDDLSRKLGEKVKIEAFERFSIK